MANSPGVLVLSSRVESRLKKPLAQLKMFEAAFLPNHHGSVVSNIWQAEAMQDVWHVATFNLQRVRAPVA